MRRSRARPAFEPHTQTLTLQGGAEATYVTNRHTTDITFTGTHGQIDAAVREHLDRWPTGGYGTWFNWPPGMTLSDGRPATNLAPFDHGNGTWTARGHRGNSCD